MRTTKKRVREALLTEEDFKPENVKVRVNFFVSADVIRQYKKEAEKLGIGYQTLMQMKLKEGIEHTVDKRLERLEKALKIKAV